MIQQLTIHRQEQIDRIEAENKKEIDRMYHNESELRNEIFDLKKDNIQKKEHAEQL